MSKRSTAGAVCWQHSGPPERTAARTVHIPDALPRELATRAAGTLAELARPGGCYERPAALKGSELAAVAPGWEALASEVKAGIGRHMDTLLAAAYTCGARRAHAREYGVSGPDAVMQSWARRGRKWPHSDFPLSSPHLVRVIWYLGNFTGGALDVYEGCSPAEPFTDAATFLRVDDVPETLAVGHNSLVAFAGIRVHQGCPAHVGTRWMLSFTAEPVTASERYLESDHDAAAMAASWAYRAEDDEGHAPGADAGVAA